MGLGQWIETKIIVGKVKSMGNVLKFLQGWKTWIWAVVMALHQAFPHWPVWGLVDSVASGLGIQATPAFDPGAAVAAVTFLWAAGDHLWQAIRQYRSGVPLSELHSVKLP